VTNNSMISLNDYYTVKNFGHIRYLVQFVNFCVTMCREGSVDLVKNWYFHLRAR